MFFPSDRGRVRLRAPGPCHLQPHPVRPGEPGVPAGHDQLPPQDEREGARHSVRHHWQGARLVWFWFWFYHSLMRNNMFKSTSAHAHRIIPMTDQLELKAWLLVETLAPVVGRLKSLGSVSLQGSWGTSNSFGFRIHHSANFQKHPILGNFIFPTPTRWDATVQPCCTVQKKELRVWAWIYFINWRYLECIAKGNSRKNKEKVKLGRFDRIMINVIYFIGSDNSS